MRYGKVRIGNWCLVSLMLTLAACSQGPTAIQVVQVPQYPNLPPINVPSQFVPLPYHWDWPRLKDALVPKNTTECLSVPKDKRDNLYWKKCGVNQVDTNSNLYIGLDSQSFTNLILNIERLVSRNKEFEARLNEYEQLREKYQQLNQEAQKKAQAVQKK